MSSEEYAEIPDYLQPPTDLKSPGYKNGGPAAVTFVEEMSSLPIGLKPRKGIHYAPPKFVYGWLMSSDEICNIIEMHHPQLVGMNNYDDEDYIDVNDTLDLVRAYFLNVLKIGKRWRPEWESVIDMTKTRFAALAITDSYENGGYTRCVLFDPGGVGGLTVAVKIRGDGAFRIRQLRS